MKGTMLILNDIHIGFDRKGGTTPQSREAMRTYLFDGFRQVLRDQPDDDLLIAGDLFDQFTVPAKDLIETFNILVEWLDQKKVRTLCLVAGNHDHKDKGDAMSSFQVLGRVLKSLFKERITFLDINQWDGNPEFCVLAHCSDQTTFEACIREAMGGSKYMVLHANYDNKFAARSDHSLNVSRDLAMEVINAGSKLVFAHEHQARTDLAGQVIIMGNQWPTSIADCLGNDAKDCYGFRNGELVQVQQTWSHDGIVDGHGFTEIDWRELGDTSYPGASFVRVVGDATADEASEVVSTIAKFRQGTDHFVIANAVRVAGIVEVDELPEAFEVAKKFDVMQYVRQHLDPHEIKMFEKLAEE